LTTSSTTAEGRLELERANLVAVAPGFFCARTSAGLVAVVAGEGRA